jgi:predicted MPP superfamily phosphohydrolase
LSPIHLTRRGFLKGSLLAGAGGTLGLAEYTRHIEPHELSIERLDIFLPRLTPEFDGFKIALMSDLHYGAYIEQLIQSAVDQASKAVVDVALLTGDFVSWHHDHGVRGARDAAGCGRVLSGLRTRFGLFGVLGNHDYAPRAEIVSEPLQAMGIRVLNNVAIPIERNNSRIWIAGVDDALEGTPDIGAALSKTPKSEPTILLAHEPDFADEVLEYPVDLQLSGHSHGGQVRFPLIGAPVLPRMGEKYAMGLYRVGKMQLYTNRGLGMIGPRIRFNCPPELTLLTLRCSQKQARSSSPSSAA